MSSCEASYLAWTSSIWDCAQAWFARSIPDSRTVIFAVAAARAPVSSACRCVTCASSVLSRWIRPSVSDSDSCAERSSEGAACGPWTNAVWVFPRWASADARNLISAFAELSAWFCSTACRRAFASPAWTCTSWSSRCEASWRALASRALSWVITLAASWTASDSACADWFRRRISDSCSSIVRCTSVMYTSESFSDAASFATLSLMRSISDARPSLLNFSAFMATLCFAVWRADSRRAQSSSFCSCAMRFSAAVSLSQMEARSSLSASSRILDWSVAIWAFAGDVTVS
ncbi:hypothetical protein DFH07DRAFT_799334 [Mycena maculata]|uniref:Uncharacterized protein n=1 Tax=Mycena maculata TaxID=230809 RepID=A0AAD7K0D9_9AGAR|nr:hypothetical protein DFH07DRAFT_799334 [Mycena maculata]